MPIRPEKSVSRQFPVAFPGYTPLQFPEALRLREASPLPERSNGTLAESPTAPDLEATKDQGAPLFLAGATSERWCPANWPMLERFPQSLEMSHSSEKRYRHLPDQTTTTKLSNQVETVFMNSILSQPKRSLDRETRTRLPHREMTPCALLQLLLLLHPHRLLDSVFLPRPTSSFMRGVRSAFIEAPRIPRPW